MKSAWMFGAAVAILFSFGCSNQKPELAADFGDLAGVDEKSDKFSKKMTVVGSLDYGETSGSVKYRNPPKYRAFKFGGQPGDQVVIDVQSKNGDSVAWLTNNAFKVLAKNDDFGDSFNSHIEATLTANSNPDIITYYIIFTEYLQDDATFTVSLGRKACIDRVFCIQGKHWDGDKCACVDDNQFCGGIAGIICPAGQKCVDNPNDSCDPNNGGADCGGICVTCIDNVACINGYHWSSVDCACMPDSHPCDTVRCAAGTTCTNCFNGPMCLAAGQFCAL